MTMKAHTITLDFRMNKAIGYGMPDQVRLVLDRNAFRKAEKMLKVASSELVSIQVPVSNFELIENEQIEDSGISENPHLLIGPDGSIVFCAKIGMGVAETDSFTLDDMLVEHLEVDEA